MEDMYLNSLCQHTKPILLNGMYRPLYSGNVTLEGLIVYLEDLAKVGHHAILLLLCVGGHVTLEGLIVYLEDLSKVGQHALTTTTIRGRSRDLGDFVYCMECIVVVEGLVV